MMSRRHSLLGSLSSGSLGRGKLINTITLKPYIDRESLHIEYNTLFPVTSVIEINVSTNGVLGQECFWVWEGESGGTRVELDVAPSTPEITVNSITPSEDDNYIYEVVIEY